MDPFESRFRVRSYELDALGHVNHAVYLNYFEQARVEALDRAGFAWSDLLARGWLFNVVHVEIDYRREARLGDDIVVSTTVADVGDTSITLRQGARRGDASGAVLAEASIVGVLVGREGRPMRVPDELRTAIGASSG